MAGRSSVEDMPLRRAFEDEDLEERQVGWSTWLHLTANSSTEEIAAAKQEQLEHDRTVDKSTMLYNVKMVFPWLWPWVERVLGETPQAREWRAAHPQSNEKSQRDKWASAKNTVNFYLQLSRILLQDLLSPDPLLPKDFDWSQYSRENSYGRSHFGSWFKGRYPFLQAKGFLALEDKAVTFYRRNHSNDWKRVEVSDLFNEDVRQSVACFHENLQRHEQKVTRNFSSAFSMLEKLAKNVEKLSEGQAAMSQSLAMLMTRPTVYHSVPRSLPQSFPLADEARPVKSSGPTAAAFCKSAEEVVKGLHEIGKQVKKPVSPNSDGSRPVDFEAVVMRK